MTEKYTYADIIIDPEDPRAEIGKEYYWSDHPSSLLMEVQDGIKQPLPLLRIVSGSEHPFKNKDAGYQCIIRKKKPEKRYVPFDLSKEEDRAKLRGAWVRKKDAPFLEQEIAGLSTNVSLVILNDVVSVGVENLLEEYEFVDGTPCGRLVED